MKSITVAIIGAGFAGNFHCNAYRKVFSVPIRLKTVCDSNMERAEALKEKWGFEEATPDYESILKDPEIDLIDITLPPVLHVDFAAKAMKAGKHVICEKPLSGYFGLPGDPEPIGDRVSKRKMFEVMMADLEKVKSAVEQSEQSFFYAENYIYSPAIVKAAEILRAKKSRVLYSVGDCSIHGSTSVLSSHWAKVGGGTLMRLGSHPIAGVLYLKQVEAEAHGEKILPVSVSAEVGRISAKLREEERKYIMANPVDVEDFSTVTITFSDGSKSVILCNDNTMGGIHNSIKLYCNDGVMDCNMTMADNMSTYFMDQDGLENVYISENMKAKTGWNKVLVAEETLRGYAEELDAFVHCIADGRKPESDFRLAYDTMKVIYAAYVSAEEGKRIQL